ACSNGPDGGGNHFNSAHKTAAKEWRTRAHWHHHWHGHKAGGPTSAASQTPTTSPSTPRTTAPSTPPKTTAPQPKTTTPPSTPKATPTASGAVARIVQLVNAERSKVGCSALTLNATLTKAAQAHSDDMAAHQNMSHTGSDGSSPGDRITRAGYSW